MQHNTGEDFSSVASSKQKKETVFRGETSCFGFQDKNPVERKGSGGERETGS